MSRRIDDRVDPSKALERRVDHPGEIGRMRDRAGHPKGAVRAHRGGGAGRREHGEPVTATREFGGDGGADAAPGCGDDGRALDSHAIYYGTRYRGPLSGVFY